MCNFLIETLKPEIFWTALAALGTFSAVLVALLLPMYNEYKRVKKIKSLITMEISNNYQIAKNLTLKPQLPNGQIVNIDPREVAKALVLDLWREYKYKLADDKPESFNKFNQANKHIDDLSNALNRMPEQVRVPVFESAISSFIEKCREELKLE